VHRGGKIQPIDIRHDGQLEGVILRSLVPHAKNHRACTRAARAVAGVAASSRAGEAAWWRFVGDPIAAVAASDREAR